MLIYVFPPHYQLVYISFDISSFSVISYYVIWLKSHSNLHQITLQSASNHTPICVRTAWNLTQIARLSDMDWFSLSHEEHQENIRVQSHRKRTGTKKEPRGHCILGAPAVKEAATYSPALHCSTIGASGLNFSVRNGKRWDPTAITTWCVFFSLQESYGWRVLSWQVDKLFVF